jgi:hypothetical protein
MSNRFGSNTQDVERFIGRLYHLNASQWEQVRGAASQRAREPDYGAAVEALKTLVAGPDAAKQAGADLSQLIAGPRPEQQNVHRAAVHCRVTCTEPLRLRPNDSAVQAAVNAAGALAARDWLRHPGDADLLYTPFVAVIPLDTVVE